MGRLHNTSIYLVLFFTLFLIFSPALPRDPYIDSVYIVETVFDVNGTSAQKIGLTITAGGSGSDTVNVSVFEPDGDVWSCSWTESYPTSTTDYHEMPYESSVSCCPNVTDCSGVNWALTTALGDNIMDDWDDADNTTGVFDRGNYTVLAQDNGYTTDDYGYWISAFDGDVVVKITDVDDDLLKGYNATLTDGTNINYFQDGTTALPGGTTDTQDGYYIFTSYNWTPSVPSAGTDVYMKRIGDNVSMTFLAYDDASDYGIAEYGSDTVVDLYNSTSHPETTSSIRILIQEWDTNTISGATVLLYKDSGDVHIATATTGADGYAYFFGNGTGTDSGNDEFTSTDLGDGLDFYVIAQKTGYGFVTGSAETYDAGMASPPHTASTLQIASNIRVQVLSWDDTNVNDATVILEESSTQRATVTNSQDSNGYYLFFSNKTADNSSDDGFRNSASEIQDADTITATASKSGYASITTAGDTYDSDAASINTFTGLRIAPNIKINVQNDAGTNINDATVSLRSAVNNMKGTNKPVAQSSSGSSGDYTFTSDDTNDDTTDTQFREGTENGQIDDTLYTYIEITHSDYLTTTHSTPLVGANLFDPNAAGIITLPALVLQRANVRFQLLDWSNAPYGSGVTVNLYRSTDDSVCEATDTQIGQNTTNANGYVYFTANESYSANNDAGFTLTEVPAGVSSEFCIIVQDSDLAQTDNLATVTYDPSTSALQNMGSVKVARKITATINSYSGSTYNGASVQLREGGAQIAIDTSAGGGIVTYNPSDDAADNADTDFSEGVGTGQIDHGDTISLRASVANAADVDSTGTAYDSGVETTQQDLGTLTMYPDIQVKVTDFNSVDIDDAKVHLHHDATGNGPSADDPCVAYSNSGSSGVYTFSASDDTSNDGDAQINPGDIPYNDDYYVIIERTGYGNKTSSTGTYNVALGSAEDDLVSSPIIIGRSIEITVRDFGGNTYDNAEVYLIYTADATIGNADDTEIAYSNSGSSGIYTFTANDDANADHDTAFTQNDLNHGQRYYINVSKAGNKNVSMGNFLTYDSGDETSVIDVGDYYLGRNIRIQVTDFGSSQITSATVDLVYSSDNTVGNGDDVIIATTTVRDSNNYFTFYANDTANADGDDHFSRADINNGADYFYINVTKTGYGRQTSGTLTLNVNPDNGYRDVTDIKIGKNIMVTVTDFNDNAINDATVTLFYDTNSQFGGESQIAVLSAKNGGNGEYIFYSNASVISSTDGFFREAELDESNNYYVNVSYSGCFNYSYAYSTYTSGTDDGAISKTTKKIGGNIKITVNNWNAQPITDATVTLYASDDTTIGDADDTQAAILTNDNGASSGEYVFYAAVDSSGTDDEFFSESELDDDGGATYYYVNISKSGYTTVSAGTSTYTSAPSSAPQDMGTSLISRNIVLTVNDYAGSVYDGATLTLVKDPSGNGFSADDIPVAVLNGGSGGFYTFLSSDTADADGDHRFSTSDLPHNSNFYINITRSNCGNASTYSSGTLVYTSTTTDGTQNAGTDYIGSNIVVHVEDWGGNAFDNARVYLFNSSDDLIGFSDLGSSGNYIFTSTDTSSAQDTFTRTELSSGNYYVKLERTGYANITSSNGNYNTNPGSAPETDLQSSPVKISRHITITVKTFDNVVFDNAKVHLIRDLGATGPSATDYSIAYSNSGSSGVYTFTADDTVDADGDNQFTESDIDDTENFYFNITDDGAANVTTATLAYDSGTSTGAQDVGEYKLGRNIKITVRDYAGALYDNAKVTLIRDEGAAGFTGEDYAIAVLNAANSGSGTYVFYSNDTNVDYGDDRFTVWDLPHNQAFYINITKPNCGNASSTFSTYASTTTSSEQDEGTEYIGSNIVVHVEDWGGNAFDNARVYLFNSSNDLIGFSDSGSLGDYTFTSTDTSSAQDTFTRTELSSGNYYVKLERTGYANITSSNGNYNTNPSSAPEADLQSSPVKFAKSIILTVTKFGGTAYDIADVSLVYDDSCNGPSASDDTKAFSNSGSSGVYTFTADDDTNDDGDNQFTETDLDDGECFYFNITDSGTAVLTTPSYTYDSGTSTGEQDEGTHKLGRTIRIRLNNWFAQDLDDASVYLIRDNDTKVLAYTTQKEGDEHYYFYANDYNEADSDNQFTPTGLPENANFYIQIAKDGYANITSEPAQAYNNGDLTSYLTVNTVMMAKNIKVTVNDFANNPVTDATVVLLADSNTQFGGESLVGTLTASNGAPGVYVFSSNASSTDGTDSMFHAGELDHNDNFYLNISYTDSLNQTVGYFTYDSGTDDGYDDKNTYTLAPMIKIKVQNWNNEDMENVMVSLVQSDNGVIGDGDDTMVARLDEDNSVTAGEYIFYPNTTSTGGTLDAYFAPTELGSSQNYYIKMAKPGYNPVYAGMYTFTSTPSSGLVDHGIWKISRNIKINVRDYAGSLYDDAIIHLVQDNGAQGFTATDTVIATISGANNGTGVYVFYANDTADNDDDEYFSIVDMAHNQNYYINITKPDSGNASTTSWPTYTSTTTNGEMTLSDEYIGANVQVRVIDWAASANNFNSARVYLFNGATDLIAFSNSGTNGIYTFTSTDSSTAQDTFTRSELSSGNYYVVVEQSGYINITSSTATYDTSPTSAPENELTSPAIRFSRTIEVTVNDFAGAAFNTAKVHLIRDMGAAGPSATDYSVAYSNSGSSGVYTFTADDDSDADGDNKFTETDLDDTNNFYFNITQDGAANVTTATLQYDSGVDTGVQDADTYQIGRNIRVRAQDWSGTDLDYARLHLIRQADSVAVAFTQLNEGNYYYFYANDTEHADADNRFTVNDLSSGANFYVVIEKPGYANVSSSVQAYDNSDLTTVLDVTGSPLFIAKNIKIRVQDYNPTDVDTADLYLITSTDTIPGNADDILIATTSTAINGMYYFFSNATTFDTNTSQFRINELPEGTNIYINITHLGARNITTDIVSYSSGNDDNEQDFSTYTISPQINIVVQDWTGAAVNDAIVRLYRGTFDSATLIAQSIPGQSGEYNFYANTTSPGGATDNFFDETELDFGQNFFVNITRLDWGRQTSTVQTYNTAITSGPIDLGTKYIAVNLLAIVTDDAGQPISDATVYLYNNTGDLIGINSTGSSGDYRFVTSYADTDPDNDIVGYSEAFGGQLYLVVEHSEYIDSNQSASTVYASTTSPGPLLVSNHTLEKSNIRLRVYDWDSPSNPVPGAKVYLFNGVSSDLVAVNNTDSNGWVQFTSNESIITDSMADATFSDSEILFGNTVNITVEKPYYGNFTYPAVVSYDVTQDLPNILPQLYIASIINASVLDWGDYGIEEATVELWKDTDGNVGTTGDQTLIAARSSAPNGYYLFYPNDGAVNTNDHYFNRSQIDEDDYVFIKATKNANYTDNVSESTTQFISQPGSSSPVNTTKVQLASGIRVHVISATGSDVPNAKVTLYKNIDDDPNHADLSKNIKFAYCLTAADGFCHFYSNATDDNNNDTFFHQTDIDHGNYIFASVKPSGSEVNMSLALAYDSSPGITEFDLGDVVTAASVRLRVYDWNGDPVNDATVYLRHSADTNVDDYATDTIVARKTTDTQGYVVFNSQPNAADDPEDTTFTNAELPDSEYAFCTVGKYGFANITQESVTLYDAASPITIDIGEERVTSNFEVNVTDWGDNPVQNAIVYLYNNSWNLIGTVTGLGTNNNYTFHANGTNSSVEGSSFKFSQNELNHNGWYFVNVTKAGYSNTTVFGTYNTAHGPYNVTNQRIAANIQIHIQDFTQSPVTDAYLYLFNSSGTLVAQTGINSAGNYTFYSNGTDYSGDTSDYEFSEDELDHNDLFSIVISRSNYGNKTVSLNYDSGVLSAPFNISTTKIASPLSFYVTDWADGALTDAVLYLYDGSLNHIATSYPAADGNYTFYPNGTCGTTNSPYFCESELDHGESFFLNVTRANYANKSYISTYTSNIAGARDYHGNFRISSNIVINVTDWNNQPLTVGTLLLYNSTYDHIATAIQIENGTYVFYSNGTYGSVESERPEFSEAELDHSGSFFINITRPGYANKTITSELYNTNGNPHTISNYRLSANIQVHIDSFAETNVDDAKLYLHDNSGALIAVANGGANGNYTFYSNETLGGEDTIDCEFSENELDHGELFTIVIEKEGYANKTIGSTYDSQISSGPFNLTETEIASNIIVYVTDWNDQPINDVTVLLYNSTWDLIGTLSISGNGNYTFFSNGTCGSSTTPDFCENELDTSEWFFINVTRNNFANKSIEGTYTANVAAGPDYHGNVRISSNIEIDITDWADQPFVDATVHLFNNGGTLLAKAIQLEGTKYMFYSNGTGTGETTRNEFSEAELDDSDNFYITIEKQHYANKTITTESYETRGDPSYGNPHTIENYALTRMAPNINVTVLNNGNNPINDATVYLYTSTDAIVNNGNDNIIAQLSQGINGEFIFYSNDTEVDITDNYFVESQLDNGTYIYFEVRHTQYVDEFQTNSDVVAYDSQPAQVPIDMGTVVLERNIIQVQVQDWSENEVDIATVYLYASADQAFGSDTLVATLYYDSNDTTDDSTYTFYTNESLSTNGLDRTFTATELPTGYYVYISVVKNGYAIMNQTTMTQYNAAITSPIDLGIQKISSTINFTVRDWTNTVIPNATVRLYSSTNTVVGDNDDVVIATAQYGENGVYIFYSNETAADTDTTDPYFLESQMDHNVNYFFSVNITGWGEVNQSSVLPYNSQPVIAPINASMLYMAPNIHITVQDWSGAPAESAITVLLFNSSDTTIGNADDTLIAQSTTQANGEYIFYADYYQNASNNNYYISQDEILGSRYVYARIIGGGYSNVTQTSLTTAYAYNEPFIYLGTEQIATDILVNISHWDLSVVNNATVQLWKDADGNYLTKNDQTYVAQTTVGSNGVYRFYSNKSATYTTDDSFNKTLLPHNSNIFINAIHPESHYTNLTSPYLLVYNSQPSAAPYEMDSIVFGPSVFAYVKYWDGTAAAQIDVQLWKDSDGNLTTTNDTTLIAVNTTDGEGTVLFLNNDTDLNNTDPYFNMSQIAHSDTLFINVSTLGYRTWTAPNLTSYLGGYWDPSIVTMQTVYTSPEVNISVFGYDDTFEDAIVRLYRKLSETDAQVIAMSYNGTNGIHRFYSDNRSLNIINDTYISNSELNVGDEIFLVISKVGFANMTTDPIAYDMQPTEGVPIDFGQIDIAPIVSLYVYGRDDEPVSDATASLFNQNGEHIATCITNNIGACNFTANATTLDNTAPLYFEDYLDNGDEYGFTVTHLDYIDTSSVSYVYNTLTASVPIIHTLDLTIPPPPPQKRRYIPKQSSGGGGAPPPSPPKREISIETCIDDVIALIGDGPVTGSCTVKNTGEVAIDVTLTVFAPFANVVVSNAQRNIGPEESNDFDFTFSLNPEAAEGVYTGNITTTCDANLCEATKSFTFVIGEKEVVTPTPTPTPIPTPTVTPTPEPVNDTPEPTPIITPEPMPSLDPLFDEIQSTPTPKPAPICGDSLCEEDENGCCLDCGCEEGYECSSELIVCVKKTECGDNKCEFGETIDNCPVDCGSCGDGVCADNENSNSCCIDCACSKEFTCNGNTLLCEKEVVEQAFVMSSGITLPQTPSPSEMPPKGQSILPSKNIRGQERINTLVSMKKVLDMKIQSETKKDYAYQNTRIVKEQVAIERVVKIKDVQTNTNVSLKRSQIIINITNTQNKTLRNVLITEVVPKSIIQSIRDKTIVFEIEPIIIEDDPVIAWNIEELKPNEHVSISYTVKKELEKKQVEAFSEPIVAEISVCGNSVCEKGLGESHSICPLDCAAELGEAVELPRVASTTSLSDLISTFFFTLTLVGLLFLYVSRQPVYTLESLETGYSMQTQVGIPQEPENILEETKNYFANINDLLTNNFSSDLSVAKAAVDVEEISSMKSTVIQPEVAVAASTTPTLSTSGTVFDAGDYFSSIENIVKEEKERISDMKDYFSSIEEILDEEANVGEVRDYFNKIDLVIEKTTQRLLFEHNKTNALIGTESVFKSTLESLHSMLSDDHQLIIVHDNIDELSFANYWKKEGIPLSVYDERLYFISLRNLKKKVLSGEKTKKIEKYFDYNRLNILKTEFDSILKISIKYLDSNDVKILFDLDMLFEGLEDQEKIELLKHLSEFFKKTLPESTHKAITLIVTTKEEALKDHIDKAFFNVSNI